MERDMRQKSCKVCKKKFRPERQRQTCCSYQCSIEYAKQLTAKREEKKKKDARKALREYKKKNDTKTLKQKAQDAVNKYIRLRDRGNTCISCCKHIEVIENSKEIMMPAGDAGHFYSVGKYPSVRFNVNNIHLECQSCNRFSEIHLIGYKENLIKKIGVDRFNALTKESKKSRRYTAYYYNRLIDIANRKIKRLEKKK